VDMVLRDSFLYVAEDNKFQVVNVARPRQPAVVGTCGLPGNSGGMCVAETLGYIANSGIKVVSLADPSSPNVIGSIPVSASGVAVRDTFAYIPHAYDTLFVYSVANPLQPRRLGFASAGVWPWDVALGESAAYVSTSTGVDVFELPNPAQPVKTGSVSTPYHAGRLAYHNGLLFVTMWDAGVAVYETVSTGIVEAPRTPTNRSRLVARPNPAATSLTLCTTNGSAASVGIRDIAGRSVAEYSIRRRVGTQEILLDIGRLRPGLYFLEVKTEANTETVKLIKR
jgi:hypothetical protein